MTSELLCEPVNLDAVNAGWEVRAILFVSLEIPFPLSMTLSGQAYNEDSSSYLSDTRTAGIGEHDSSYVFQCFRNLISRHGSSYLLRSWRAIEGDLTG